MAPLPNPAPGDSVAAAHIDSIRTHLEGGSGDTAPYKLRQSTGDFIVVLADAAGASEVSIHDSADVEVAHINSDGDATFNSVAFTNLDIPVSASPSQTADGRAVWDSDDDVLTIGDGASRKTFYPGRDFDWVGGDTTERTTTSVTSTDLSTITGLSIAAGVPILITGNVRKTSGNASAVYLGLKLNSTAVITVGAGEWTVATAVDRAEQGIFRIYVAPRVTGYLRAGIAESFTGTGTTVTIQTNTQVHLGSADAPTATITSITITGATGNAANTIAIDDIHVYALAVA